MPVQMKMVIFPFKMFNIEMFTILITALSF